MEKYLDRDWKIVGTVVIKALGSVTKEFDGWIKKLGNNKQCWSNAKDCIVGNCEDIDESGDVKT